MTTEKQNEGQQESEAPLLLQAEEQLVRVQARIGRRFRRAEARKRAQRFLQGLLAPIERKNGWQVAARTG